MYKIILIMLLVFWGFMYLNLGNKYLSEADGLYKEKRLDEAIFKYSEAIKIFHYQEQIKMKSNIWIAYFSRWDTYEKNGNKQKALEDYLESEKYGYNDEVLFNNIWLIYYDQKLPIDATSYYNKALKINPNSSTTYYNKGFLYQWEKNYNEALKNYNKAIELGYDDSAIYFHRLLINQELWNKKEVKKDFETLKTVNIELYNQVKNSLKL